MRASAVGTHYVLKYYTNERVADSEHFDCQETKFSGHSMTFRGIKKPDNLYARPLYVQ